MSAYGYTGPPRPTMYRTVVLDVGLTQVPSLEARVEVALNAFGNTYELDRIVVLSPSSPDQQRERLLVVMKHREL